MQGVKVQMKTRTILEDCNEWLNFQIPLVRKLCPILPWSRIQMQVEGSCITRYATSFNADPPIYEYLLSMLHDTYIMQTCLSLQY